MKSHRRAAIVSCLLALALPPVAEAQESAEEPAMGLWAYESKFPVGLAGELTVMRRDGSWQGSIGGATAEAQANGNEVRIEFPDEGGLFRGYLDPEGRLLRGFWVRREITDDPRYPEGAAQAYAMPLSLRPDGVDRWHANVAPLPDPFTLFLNVFRDESGVLKAAIRNPEHHRFGPAMQLFATLEGDRLRLGAAAEPGEDDLVAIVKRESGRIEMRWESMRRTISLARATPAQAALFTARPRSEPRYVYRQAAGAWRMAGASRACRRSRCRRGRDRARGAAHHRHRSVRPARVADPLDGDRLQGQAHPRRVFLRPRARNSARHAFGQQDVLVRHPGRGDAGRRKDFPADKAL